MGEGQGPRLTPGPGGFGTRTHGSEGGDEGRVDLGGPAAGEPTFGLLADPVEKAGNAGAGEGCAAKEGSRTGAKGGGERGWCARVDNATPDFREEELEERGRNGISVDAAVPIGEKAAGFGQGCGRFRCGGA